jgi:hypothetical protein
VGIETVNDIKADFGLGLRAAAKVAAAQLAPTEA